MEESKKICFVIMPIADSEGYEKGHFKRVYDFIIKPACEQAGFEPIRADDVKATNNIVVDIIKKIVECDMAICDLSSRNPNVLYELGMRHSFNLPVTLIKDNNTDRIFDIQGLRDIEYDWLLRIDNVEKVVKIIAESIRETYDNRDEKENSILHSLKLKSAKVEGEISISSDTEILLDAIHYIRNTVEDLDYRINNSKINESYFKRVNRSKEVLENVEIGDFINHNSFGELRVDKKYKKEKSGERRLIVTSIKHGSIDVSAYDLIDGLISHERPIYKRKENEK